MVSSLPDTAIILNQECSQFSKNLKGEIRVYCTSTIPKSTNAWLSTKGIGYQQKVSYGVSMRLRSPVTNKNKVQYVTKKSKTICIHQTRTKTEIPLPMNTLAHDNDMPDCVVYVEEQLRSNLCPPNITQPHNPHNSCLVSCQREGSLINQLPKNTTCEIISR